VKHVGVAKGAGIGDKHLFLFYSTSPQLFHVSFNQIQHESAILTRGDTFRFKKNSHLWGDPIAAAADAGAEKHEEIPGRTPKPLLGSLYAPLGNTQKRSPPSGVYQTHHPLFGLPQKDGQTISYSNGDEDIISIGENGIPGLISPQIIRRSQGDALIPMLLGKRDQLSF
jgi:hypothetical protein